MWKRFDCRFPCFNKTQQHNLTMRAKNCPRSFFPVFCGVPKFVWRREKMRNKGLFFRFVTTAELKDKTIKSYLFPNEREKREKKNFRFSFSAFYWDPQRVNFDRGIRKRRGKTFFFLRGKEKSWRFFVASSSIVLGGINARNLATIDICSPRQEKLAGSYRSSHVFFFFLIIFFSSVIFKALSNSPSTLINGHLKLLARKAHLQQQLTSPQQQQQQQQQSQQQAQLGASSSTLALLRYNNFAKTL